MPCNPHIPNLKATEDCNVPNRIFNVLTAKEGITHVGFQNASKVKQVCMTCGVASHDPITNWGT
jgi:hypothetical protein